MDVNLPFLGASESCEPSISSINMAGSVGILIAKVPINASVKSAEQINHIIDIGVKSDSSVLDIDIDIGLSAPITIYDAETNLNVAAITKEGVTNPTPLFMADTHEVHVDVDVAIVAETKEQAVAQYDILAETKEQAVAQYDILAEAKEQAVVQNDITIQSNAGIHYHDLSYNMLNLIAVFQRTPFFAGKITGRTSHIDALNMVAEATETGDVMIGGNVADGGEFASVDINVPVTSVTGGYIENLNIPSDISIFDYVTISPVAAYAISLSIPLNMLGVIQSGAQPEFSVEAAINSVDILLTAEVFDRESVRYEIADIDHGIADGKVKIFANEWTLCFVNKPVNGDGTPATVTSFLMSELANKYGADLYTKISMIVAKHPETGIEYNFVVQEGYSTPEGSINDFPMCYFRDGAYYPVPFMVQSVSDETLEIDWSI